MKTLTQINWLLAILMLLQVQTSIAQTRDEIITEQITVNVPQAGTLSILIGESRRNQIANLKLTGCLNGSDICVIREMAGSDDYGNPTNGNLEYLDLSEASIKSGGDPYLQAFITITAVPPMIGAIITDPTDYTSIWGSFLITGDSSLLPKDPKLFPWYITTEPTYTTENEISFGMFYNCNKLKTVKLPYGTNKIDAAFLGCAELTSVDIPQSVTTLEGTFNSCPKLTEVYIPESVKSLTMRRQLPIDTRLWLGEKGGMYQPIIPAFYNCPKLKSIHIPKGIKDMSYCILACPQLESTIDLSDRDSLTYISLESCPSLTSISLPASIEGVHIEECPNLSSVNFATSTSELNGVSFLGCSKLKSIELPNCIKSLSFQGCTSLTSINVPDNVTKLERAFQGCTSLTSVNIPDNVTNLSYAFQGCTSLSTVNIPDNVTDLSYAFQGCTSLSTVCIPEYCAPSSAYQAFAHCTHLASIIFLGAAPQFLDYLGYPDYPFERCDNIQSFRFLVSMPPAFPKNGMPQEFKKKLTVYIPKGSYQYYWLSDWSYYNLVEFDATGIDSPPQFESKQPAEYFSIDGKKLNAMQKGINIIRNADGNTKKILIR